MKREAKASIDAEGMDRPILVIVGTAQSAPATSVTDGEERRTSFCNGHGRRSNREDRWSDWLRQYNSCNLGTFKHSRRSDFDKERRRRWGSMITVVGGVDISANCRAHSTRWVGLDFDFPQKRETTSNAGQRGKYGKRWRGAGDSDRFPTNTGLTLYRSWQANTTFKGEFPENGCPKRGLGYDDGSPAMADTTDGPGSWILIHRNGRRFEYKRKKVWRHPAQRGQCTLLYPNLLLQTIAIRDELGEFKSHHKVGIVGDAVIVPGAVGVDVGSVDRPNANTEQIGALNGALNVENHSRRRATSRPTVKAMIGKVGLIVWHRLMDDRRATIWASKRVFREFCAAITSRIPKISESRGGLLVDRISLGIGDGGNASDG
ncbi:hypothetical protein DFH07DRAFT_939287 [Mycena maculata]|uniref:Uncharacterized protein n=1 Tax=Mycena maculata TaxID=230809 RepID=A0AAD7JHS7_9AGAR|nr:hypothetical protein DFH07DRAFT_939287 [Mycena maculata]